MARKTKEQVQREADQRAWEIKQEAQSMAKEMVPDLVRAIMEATGGNRPAGAAAGPAFDVESAQILAVAIAGASDPGNKSRRVSPEVLEARKAAHDELIQLLATAWAQSGGDVRSEHMPLYTVTSKCFLKERKIEPKFFNVRTKELQDMVIAWPQIPNEAMVPHNQAATNIHAKFLESIGSMGGRVHPAAAFVISGDKMMRTVPVTAQVHVEQPMDSFDPRMTIPTGGKSQTRINVLGTIAPPAVVS